MSSLPDTTKGITVEDSMLGLTEMKLNGRLHAALSAKKINEEGTEQLSFQDHKLVSSFHLKRSCVVGDLAAESRPAKAHLFEVIYIIYFQNATENNRLAYAGNGPTQEQWLQTIYPPVLTYLCRVALQGLPLKGR